MKHIPFIMLTALAGGAAAQGQVLDLTDPHNYAQQAVPGYITKDNTPPDNEITDLGATLGRVLFYDRRLSRNDTVSCASCHHQENAFGDTAQASVGVAGLTGRHSMRLINARFADERRFFWDERATSAEDQASKPIQDHVEMGFSGTNGDPGFPDLVIKLSAIEEYQVLFSGVFGDPAITEDRVQRSLAQFVRSIQSFDSKYDEGRAVAGNDGAPFPNFTVQENQGKQIFMGPANRGGAGCAACHQAPEFDITPNSGNNGIIAALGGGNDFTNTRSPSLRDLVDADGHPHGGFMHNAALPDLMAVVDHYNAIPAVVPGLDPRLQRRGGPPGTPPQPQRLNLDQTEKEALVAFLTTLTGRAVYTDPKWSDPFDENGVLTCVVLPQGGVTVVMSGAGPDQAVRVRMTGVPNVEYAVQSSTDMRTWSSVEVMANALGEVTADFAAPASEAACYYRVVYAPGGGGAVVAE